MDLLLFRLSLKVKEPLDMFAARGEDGKILPREEWLRRFFRAERQFTHFGSSFYFVPEPGISQSAHSRYLFGWIAREKRLLERTPPSEGLEPTEHMSWQAAFVAMDPSDHSDGQKIAVESNTAVGSPASILRSLVKAMNFISDAPYSCDVFPIVEEASFWKFAEAHNEQIRSITFDVAAPNMFGDANDFQNELRSLRDNENVSKIKTTLESDTVLNHRTARIADIVNYTERGAGTLSATSLDGKTYNSERHQVSASVPVQHHSKGLGEFLSQIIQFVDRIF